MVTEGQEALRPRGRKAQLGSSQLRPGWTTGAYVYVTATSASAALETSEFLGPVGIALPGGRETTFALTQWQLQPGLAMAAITRDAGGDPDVIHGTVVWVMVELGEPGGGVKFTGGEGVGTVTLPGLPLPVGEPAINPKPRKYITANVTVAAECLGVALDVCVTVSIDDDACIAEKTWNSRIGMLGGLNVLGTTGVVVPYSCPAWIASIHRGIDVIIATDTTHAATCAGSTPERVAEELHLGIELLDMGDFTSAVLKYLRKHPLLRFTTIGGVARLSKLTVGYFGLHPHRTRIQPGYLRQLAEEADTLPELVEAVGEAATVAYAITLTDEVDIDPPQLIADSARDEALAALGGAPVEVEIVVTNHAGRILVRAR